MNHVILSLRPVDILVILFINILSFLSVVFWTEVGVFLVILNGVVSVLIILCSRVVSSIHSTAAKGFYDWYPIPMIFFIFKEVHVVIQSVGRADWDNVFIQIDRTLFGIDPTIWMMKFSNPVFTELLQIAYASYYFIMLAVGIELYLRGEKEKFRFSAFIIVYGFVLSYVGYLAFPAVGPRFTLHDFSSINVELPGLWLTNTIRDLINAGESIPRNALNAIALAQRDVFPSGHTQMTLVSMYLAHRYKLKSRIPINIFGVLLILSTIYLRYHYVVDVVGGILFMILTVWSAPKLVRWWESFQIKEKSGK